jgi:hypothetical protein
MSVFAFPFRYLLCFRASWFMLKRWWAMDIISFIWGNWPSFLVWKFQFFSIFYIGCTNKMARFGVQFLMYVLPSDLLCSTMEFICISSKNIFLSSRCLVEGPFDFIMLISWWLFSHCILNASFSLKIGLIAWLRTQDSSLNLYWFYQKHQCLQ